MKLLCAAKDLMIKAGCSVLLCVFSADLSAQAAYFLLNGKVIDQTAAPLEAATLMLIRQSDTAFVQGARSDSLGNYQINGLESGDYWLVVSYLGYLANELNIQLDGMPRSISQGDIVLKDNTALLKEIEITAKATPVIVRNDTTYYNSSSFQTRPNAAVLDLLKKLPGIEVKSDGTIIAQGKKVQNILVDGKIFFGEDTSTPTKVLPADAIQTVEVYDESSQKADFTGITDPDKEKTINLVLKEDRKKGWFGESSAGAGGSSTADKRYDLSVNMNRFAPDRQRSVVGTLNNTGTYLNGLQNSQSLGANANQTIFKKIQANANTNWNRGQLNGVQNTTRQVFLPTGTLTSLEKNQQTQRSQDLSASFSANQNTDTLTIFSLNGSGNWGQVSGTDQRESSTKGEGGLSLNSAQGTNQSRTSTSGGSIDLLYGRRAAKTTRNFTISGSGGYNNGEGETHTTSNNAFYERGSSINRLDTIAQKAIQKNNAQQASLRTSIGEPIGKDLILQTEYGLTLSQNSASQNTFDLRDGNLFFNDSLSNNIFNRSLQHQLSLQTQVNKNKWSYFVALTGLVTTLSAKNTDSDNQLVKRSFFGSQPSISAYRSFNQENSSLRFDYRSEQLPPALAQLQAVPDRSDPLNIRVGNPRLKPETGHHLTLGYSTSNPKKGSSFFINTNTDYTQNRIIEVITIDSSFIRSYRPQNMQGEIGAGTSISYGLSLEKWKSNFSIGTNVNFTSGKAFLNDRQNSMRTSVLNQTINWGYSPYTWLNHSLSTGVSVNTLRYSIDKDLDQSYTDQYYQSALSLTLPKRWQVYSDANISVRKGRADGFNVTVPIWNLTFSKRLLSADRMEVSLAINDVLNRNVSINRSTNLNYVEDVQSNILSRYLLLRVRYTLMAI
jgi:Outer membrane protein beta-barrel family/Carboxypeptidase regulatory-like domain